MCELGIEYEILFLDADDETLVKRYKETRRTHPLAKEDRIETGIAREREMISFIRDSADYIIDTTTLLTRELRQEEYRLMQILYLMFASFRILIMSRHYVHSQGMIVLFRNMS